MRRVNRHGGGEVVASKRALPVVWVLAGLFLRLFLRGRPRSMAGATVSGLTLRVVGVLLLYLLMGVMALSTWKLGIFERSTTLHAFTLMMVGMMMAGSSGTLLFNAEEADILLHRPVTPRALLAAKVCVMVAAGVGLALALNVVGLVVGVWGPHGSWLFVPAHVCAMMLEVVFAASLVTLAYGWCLRCFGRERLDNFMTVAQVVVAVGAMAGGQLVPRLLLRMDGADVGEASP